MITKEQSAYTSEIIAIKIGIKLRRARKKSGFTQKMLGAAIGCTHQKVARYESGETIIPAVMLYEISKAIGVNMEIFFEDLGLDRTLSSTGIAVDRRGAVERLSFAGTEQGGYPPGLSSCDLVLGNLK